MKFDNIYIFITKVMCIIPVYSVIYCNGN